MKDNIAEYTLNIAGKLLSLRKPLVMGILNCTPDSFYEGSRKQTEMEIAVRANEIIEDGGQIIDVGAFSTRPGADQVSEEEMRCLASIPSVVMLRKWLLRSLVLAS